MGVCVVLTHFVYTDSRGIAHEGDLRDLAAYNLKIAPCDPHHDARRQALGAAHLVRGPVRLIHHKNLKHPHGLCKLVNAAASATRVVVGATACAMHDPNEIRVHEIGDGSPWLAAD